ncbi:hypothetical protein JI721_09115 [Alicyclobacillus cycloheptanicus]|uniref:Lipoprotein n=1 Tax=Alicyclobacillus cycloheptanicus TaxID=1457 RepID=A0ABT9XH74_9BACL|nr:hypothetical protein [Alicyclobacillus cycloheptanicus]MDQ0189630.1 hypothetical protein [Alicyclobacillus cycloheptanicus]WDL99936.1 hypothetical protein JI721_09115 [Alicyclobacillus cycloheptanicus]
MKKIAFGIGVCIFIGVAATGCGQSQTVRHGTDTTLAREYSSVGQLISDSSDVVKGKALSGKSFTYHGVTFTDTYLIVSKELRGTNIRPGSTIEVLETGGPNSPVNDDIYPMKDGKQYILFLTPYSRPIPDQQYVIVGSYQGRFDLESGDNIASVTNNSPLKNVTSLSKLEATVTNYQ